MTQSGTRRGILSIIVGILVKYNTIFIFAVLVILSSALSTSFFTLQNIFNVLRLQAPHLCISMGLLFVMLIGGIDLAAGATAGLTGMIMVMSLTKWGFFGYGGLAGAILVALAVAVVIGLLIGILISYVNLVPFIVTLAFSSICRGLTYILSGGQPVRLESANPGSAFWIDMGAGSVPGLGIPWAVLITFIFIIAFHLIKRYTGFGRMLLATGSNEEAVRLSGVNVNKYKISGYVISAFMAATAGMLIAARASIAAANAGTNYELDAIAGCVIGGVAMKGGKGDVFLVVIGSLTLGLIGNIMNLLSLAAYPQQVIKGCIILAAIILQIATDTRERK